MGLQALWRCVRRWQRRCMAGAAMPTLHALPWSRLYQLLKVGTSWQLHESRCNVSCDMCVLHDAECCRQNNAVPNCRCQRMSAVHALSLFAHTFRHGRRLPWWFSRNCARAHSLCPRLLQPQSWQPCCGPEALCCGSRSCWSSWRQPRLRVQHGGDVAGGRPEAAAAAAAGKVPSCAGACAHS